MTDEYDPEQYWNVRAKSATVYQAVCVYNASSAQNAAAEKIQLLMLGRLRRWMNLHGAKVMELGCGVGRLAPWFIQQGAHYTGTDLAANMIEAARQNVPDTPFFKLDSSALPFPENSFDLTFSVTVLHHNPHERQEELIRELIRVTRPGGFILLMEGCSAHSRRTGFVMFPRAFGDWVQLVEGVGPAHLVDYQPLRWWLFYEILRYPVRLVQSQLRVKIGGLKNTWVLRLGSQLDPYLLRILPMRFASNALMIFQKDINREEHRVP